MRALVGLFIALCCTACGDHVQRAEPPERGARTAPGAPASRPQATQIPMHGTQSSDAPAPTTDPAPSEAVVFAGRIEADPGLALPASFTIFVAAGPPPSGRPPVFNRRYDRAALPLDFELSRSDLPFGDEGASGPMSVYAILSEAGHIGASSGLYVVSEPSAPAEPGARGLRIVLRRGP